MPKVRPSDLLPEALLQVPHRYQGVAPQTGLHGRAQQQNAAVFSFCYLEVFASTSRHYKENLKAALSATPLNSHLVPAAREDCKRGLDCLVAKEYMEALEQIPAVSEQSNTPQQTGDENSIGLFKIFLGRSLHRPVLCNRNHGWQQEVFANSRLYGFSASGSFSFAMLF